MKYALVSRWLWCLLLLGCHALAAHAQPNPVIEQADTAPQAATPTQASVLELRQARLEVRLRDGKDKGATLPSFSLPLHWDIPYRRKAGWATAHLAFDLPTAQRQVPHAMLIPRLGNAYRVTLNGEVLATGGDLRTPNDGWTGRRPLWLRLPTPLLQEHNVLVITIRADYLRRAGISPVQVGPESLLQERWHALEWERVTLPRAISLFSLVVGAFCLLLWWQQRQALYAYAALCELLWACRITAIWIEDIPLTWPSWFQAVQGFFWAGCLSLYWLARAVWASPRSRTENVLAAVLFGLCPLAVWLGANAVLAWTAIFLVAWAALIVQLARECKRPCDGPRMWMLLALVACWAALVRDITAARLAPAQYMNGGWTMWAALLAGMAVLAIAGQRFQQARQQVVDLTTSLERRLNEREAKLAQQHEALRQLERTHAKSEERARILRDMHDGAGAHLITAMRQLEGGTASQAQVMQTLRESLDQLRLSVDAMSLPTGDVNALLASLRFRLEQRIRDSGLELQWDVDLLPLWPHCSDEAMGHLQHIIFEAISNVLQHAQATELRLSAHADARSITIRLRDNGMGKQDCANGNGLRTMQERADLIGASLFVGMEDGGGTTVQVVLPFAP